jgi:hypothetical protein
MQQCCRKPCPDQHLASNFPYGQTEAAFAYASAPYPKLTFSCQIVAWLSKRRSHPASRPPPIVARPTYSPCDLLTPPTFQIAGQSFPQLARHTIASVQLSDIHSQQLLIAIMFDENFSFLSPTSNTNSISYADCTSTDVSPFTSRSSSPRPYLRNSSTSAPSIQPHPRRDSRFNSITSMPSNVSITALTAQLETHALSSEAAAFTSSPTATTPSYSDFSDEGFVDGPTSSDTDPEFDPILWDLSTSDLHITSSPRNSAGANSLPSFALRRRQRQALVRLQCLAQRTPDLMMLVEECHPSSMPLPEEPVWGSGAKRQHSVSMSSLSTGGRTGTRVEKERSLYTAVKRAPRMRKRNTS